MVKHKIYEKFQQAVINLGGYYKNNDFLKKKSVTTHLIFCVSLCLKTAGTKNMSCPN